MGGDFINKFFKDIFNKGNYKDYFKRNKVFLLVSIAVIILSLWSGFTSYSSYTQMLTNFGALQPTATSPFAMFEESLTTNLIIILAGFTFSVLSVLFTVVKGVSVGYLFATQNIGQLLPQAIEIISQIFTLIGAFLVTKIEIRLISILINRKFDTIYTRIKAPLKDLILTIVFIIILLLITLIIGMII